MPFRNATVECARTIHTVNRRNNESEEEEKKKRSVVLLRSKADISNN